MISAPLDRLGLTDGGLVSNLAAFARLTRAPNGDPAAGLLDLRDSSRLGRETGFSVVGDHK